MKKNNLKIGISFNSPVILTFVITCVAVLILDNITGSKSTELCFSIYRSSLWDPFTYMRFFGHILGHGGTEHLFGNMMLLLVLGPLLEEKYGSRNMVSVILLTAFVTGLIHFILFPKTVLLGASGVVFAFILLSSFTSIKEGKIPATFILVTCVYIGQQVYDGIFVKDNVSNLTHILGAVTGSGFGYAMYKNKMQ